MANLVSGKQTSTTQPNTAQSAQPTGVPASHLDALKSSFEPSKLPTTPISSFSAARANYQTAAQKIVGDLAAGLLTSKNAVAAAVERLRRAPGELSKSDITLVCAALDTLAAGLPSDPNFKPNAALNTVVSDLGSSMTKYALDSHFKNTWTRVIAQQLQPSNPQQNITALVSAIDPSLIGPHGEIQVAGISRNEMKLLCYGILGASKNLPAGSFQKSEYIEAVLLGTTVQYEVDFHCKGQVPGAIVGTIQKLCDYTRIPQAERMPDVAAMLSPQGFTAALTTLNQLIFQSNEEGSVHQITRR